MKKKQNNNRRWSDVFDMNFEKITRRSEFRPNRQAHNAEKEKQCARSQAEFRCTQCGQVVSTSRECSGVNNRNHCPVCLWSRHVDHLKAGDRRSGCRSRMEPLGLTLKHTPKRYGGEQQGELMLIHRCAGCGKLSINRVAADDNAASIYKLFLRAQHIDAELLSRLKAQGITPLLARDLTTVHTQLFGWQSLLDEFQAGEVNTVAVEAGSLLHRVEQE